MSIRTATRRSPAPTCIALAAGLGFMGTTAAQSSAYAELRQDGMPLQVTQAPSGPAMATIDLPGSAWDRVFTTPGSAASFEGRVLAAPDTATLRVGVELARRDPMPTSGYGGTLTTGKGYGAFERDVTVDAGTSGLAAGSPVTIEWRLRLDGQLATGWLGDYDDAATAPPSYNLLASVDSAADFRVFDPNLTAWVCNDGCGWVTGVELLRFRAHGREVYSQMLNTPWDDGDLGQIEYQSTWDWGLRLGGNTVASGGLPDTYEAHDGWVATQRQATLDTGMLSFQYLTTVGATNRISGSLDLLLQAMGVALTAGATGDLSQTFDVELSVLGAPGVQLIGHTLGATQFDGSIVAVPVPEPATPLLMAAGLAAVAGWRRQMRRDCRA